MCRTILSFGKSFKNEERKTTNMYILTDGNKRISFENYADMITYWRKLPTDEAMRMSWMFE